MLASSIRYYFKTILLFMYFFLSTEEKFRVDIDKVWKEEIWPKASNIAEIIGTNLSAPCRVPPQTMRSNVAGSAQDFSKSPLESKCWIHQF